MRISKKKKMKYFRISAVILLILILLFSSYVLFDYFEKRNSMFSEEEVIPTIEYNGKIYELKDNIRTVLLIGVDKFSNDIPDDSFRNNQQSDFIILLAINDEEKTCTPIQISRDSMVDVYILGIAGDRIDKSNMQLALSHTYGNGKQVSCRNTCDSVSTLFPNVDINDYVSFTMNAVPVLNDLVDGVEVKITDDFSDIDKTLVKGKTVTLMGEHALNFVRGRYKVADQSNINRMARQRVYIDSLVKKYRAEYEKNENILSSAASKVNKYLLSNMDIYTIEDLAEDLVDYELQDIIFLEGDYVKGKEYMEFYLDKDFLMKTVVDNFYIEKSK